MNNIIQTFQYSQTFFYFLGIGIYEISEKKMDNKKSSTFHLLKE